MNTTQRKPVLFVVKLYALPGTDGVRALKAALKLLLRKFGLRAISVQQVEEDAKPERARQ
jgi:hypothetical protein